ncbi:MAG: YgiT-type zinc finger protein [Planctomycetota bacterium]
MNKMIQKHDNCEFCGGTVLSKKVTKYYATGKIIAVIEGIPAYVCQTCGERYYDAKVLKAINHLIKTKQHIKRRLSVPVLEFQLV